MSTQNFYSMLRLCILLLTQWFDCFDTHVALDDRKGITFLLVLSLDQQFLRTELTLLLFYFLSEWPIFPVILRWGCVPENDLLLLVDQNRMDPLPVV